MTPKLTSIACENGRLTSKVTPIFWHLFIPDNLSGIITGIFGPPWSKIRRVPTWDTNECLLEIQFNLIWIMVPAAMG